jgi:hypothetical protein
LTLSRAGDYVSQPRRQAAGGAKTRHELEAGQHMVIWLTAAGAVVLIWVVLNVKKSRPDGIYLKRVHPFRTMMGHIMPTRNESVVYYDTYVNAEPLEAYLAEAKEKLDANLTHCLVAAAVFGFFDNPEMNVFISGRRLYKRKDIRVTFSAKRKKLNEEGKLTALKYVADPSHTFEDLVKWVNEKLTEVRTDKKTHEDKELGFFTSWPRPLLRFGVNVVRWLDYHNILLPSFIENDGFYTGLFIANLGSVNMDAGYHHLYEWGNCPLFMMVGKIHDRPVAVNGEVKVQRTMHVRWSLDERVEDGLTSNFGINSVKHALERPYEYFGCLKEDGSDRKAISQLPTAHPGRKRKELV